MTMRYFSSVQGLLFLRPGKPGIYIGCKRKPKNEPGFVWNIDAVIAVTEAEVKKNLRDWNDAVRQGVLIKKTEVQFTAAAKAQEAAQREAVAEAKVAKAEAVAAKNKAAKDKADETTTTEEG